MPALDCLSLDRIDAELGLVPLFVSIAPADLISLKVLLESYEGVGVIRTQERCFAPGRALIVMLLVADAIEDARSLLSEFLETASFELIDETPELLAELKRDLLEYA